MGEVLIIKESLNNEIFKQLEEKYIALDTETTGLDFQSNQITEIGLALFEHGKKTKEYTSLIQINDVIPSYVEELTGITNEMLSHAPKPSIVYKEVYEFIKDALDEKIILVAHNGIFDMSFLKPALEAYGYFGTIHYVDTLSISRKYVRGLLNYKQDTVATYFGIINKQAHRALTDAITCGLILKNLLDVYNKQDQMQNFVTKYDNQFDKLLRERGLIYYRFNTIHNYQEDGNKCSASIEGSLVYTTSLEIDNGIIKGKCNCANYMINDQKCKHIYALLLKYLENKDMKN